MSKLDDILEAVRVGGVYDAPDPGDEDGTPLSPEEAKQRIKDLFIELVGEDERLGLEATPSTITVGEARNKWRKELRKEIESL